MTISEFREELLKLPQDHSVAIVMSSGETSGYSGHIEAAVHSGVRDVVFLKGFFGMGGAGSLRVIDDSKSEADDG